MLSRNIRLLFLVVCCFLPLSFIRAEVLYLEPGESHLIEVSGQIETVFLANPQVADYELISPKTIMLYAKKEGITDLQLLEKSGGRLLKVSVHVDPLLSRVYQQLRQLLPNHPIKIDKIGRSYVISGTVPNEEYKEQIYHIVGRTIGAEKKVAPVSKGKNVSLQSSTHDMEKVIYDGVINKLELPITNQVNVKLSVVNVTKEFTDNIGIDWGSLNGSRQITPGQFRIVNFTADKLGNIVRAINNENIAQLLAEPNLSVLSGETAEFLVGGEIPIAVSTRDQISIQYKEFGVKLSIAAKVNNDKRIWIQLSEEVSNPMQNFIAVAGFSMPSFQTKRAKTTIELADGESFLIGGLINHEDIEEVSKIPLFGDIPILGALFRNTKTTRLRSELIVVATVNLVKPILDTEIIWPTMRRTSTLSRFLNFDALNSKHRQQQAKQFIEQGGFIP